MRMLMMTKRRWPLCIGGYTEGDKASTKIFQHARKNHVGPTFNHVAKVGTSSSPGGECLNFGNPPQISPAVAAISSRTYIAQSWRNQRNSKQLAIRWCRRTTAEVYWKSLTGKNGGSCAVTVGTPHRRLSARISVYAGPASELARQLATLLQSCFRGCLSPRTEPALATNQDRNLAGPRVPTRAQTTAGDIDVAIHTSLENTWWSL